MAVAHITFNESTQYGAKLRTALSKLGDGLDELNALLGIMAQMLDGDGTASEHFDYFVSKFGFADSAGAKACYDELNSLAFKLNTDASVSNVHAAILQALNKLG